MPQPKTQEDLRAFRQERGTAAGADKPARREPAKKDPARGGIVWAVESLGIICALLGLTGVILSVLAACAAIWTGVDAYVGISSSVFTVLAGVVFLWMGEVLYLLRRIDGRGG